MASCIVTCSRLLLEMDNLEMRQDGSLRLLYIDDANVVSCNMRENTSPIFMAADIFKYYASSSKNDTRIHQRYSNNGDACRLFITNARLKEGANTQHVWFYTIQGLFRLAFEYMPDAFQHACMDQLQDTWLKHRLKKLPSEIAVTYMISERCEAVSENPEPTTSVRPQVEQTQRSEHQNILPGSSENVHDHKLYSLETADDFVSYVKKLHQSLQRIEKTLEGENDSYNCSLLLSVCKYISLKYSQKHLVDNFPLHLLNYYVDIMNDKTQCSKFVNEFDIPISLNVSLCLLCEWLGKEFQSLAPMIAQKVESFKTLHIDSIDNLPSPCELVQTLFPRCMVLLLENWMASSTEAHTGQDYHRFYQSKETEYLNTPDIPRTLSTNDHSGPQTQSHSLHSENSLDTNELLDMNNAVSMSISSSPTLNTQCRKRKRENDCDSEIFSYPVIQLILEFANSTLVSGVSHVVYSRLLH